MQLDSPGAVPSGPIAIAGVSVPGYGAAACKLVQSPPVRPVFIAVLTSGRWPQIQIFWLQLHCGSPLKMWDRPGYCRVDALTSDHGKTLFVTGAP